jgi:hypothetical protein
VGVILLVVGGMSLIIEVLDRIGLVRAALHRIGVPLEDRNAQGSHHDSGAPEQPPDDSPGAEAPDQSRLASQAGPSAPVGRWRAGGSSSPSRTPPSSVSGGSRRDNAGGSADRLDSDAPLGGRSR